MAICKGDKQIVKIYRGDKEITKVYRGDTQVFSGGKRILLFMAGTTAVYKAKYIVNNTTNDINIEFNCSSNTQPQLRKYEFTYKNMGSYFYRQKQGTTRIYRVSQRFGGVSNDYSFPLKDNIIHNVVIDKTKLYIDGSYVRDFEIGNTIDEGTTQRIAIGYGGCYLYEMKIYQDDELIYHFVPAYFMSGGTLNYGIADLVNQYTNFHPNLIGEPEYE